VYSVASGFNIYGGQGSVDSVALEFVLAEEEGFVRPQVIETMYVIDL
jgi:hypothetical protein